MGLEIGSERASSSIKNRKYANGGWGPGPGRSVKGQQEELTIKNQHGFHMPDLCVCVGEVGYLTRENETGKGGKSETPEL